MKVVLIAIGALAALYTVAGIVQFIGILLKSDPSSAYGASMTAAGIVPICLGLLVALVCFKNAFGKTK